METASLWQARLDSGAADPAEFEAWRAADPRHAAAFARIAGTVHQLERAKRAHPALRPAPVRLASRRRFLAAGGGLMAAGLAGVAFLPSLARARARTGVGEHQRLSPAKGLDLDINTDSTVSWRSGPQTAVWLERGELALAVAPGASPCQLSGGEGRLTVVSGTLNARLRGEALDLMVMEGDCVIIPERTPIFENSGAGVAGRPLTIKSGHAIMATATATRLRPVNEGDVAFTGGWRQGELILDGQTLGTAVDEYNRYLKQRIVIADPQLESVRLGGRFNTRNPDDFLSALNAGFGIHVLRDPSGEIILTK
ncbi:DUF4880 domain-containing protein [Asticcacaulis sp. AND118]|uniref:FecR family protein n=1 Tax=Asticcacaulis sp. AND118 TaxID=2840468 RepID=UPI001CFFB2B6|nr:DUF4880 domain-containing protein [Asticcacaulis sp. AND118]UDF04883.1 DUF4880 domain-containing protein [Asticcacaulis sp. AND118]